MGKNWSDDELAQLEREAAGLSIDELATSFQTDAESVRSKLTELGLSAKAGRDAENEAAIADFASGLEHLHKKEWSKAAEKFEQVIKAADGIHLADRARQNLTICEDRLNEAGEETEPYLLAVFEKNRGNYGKALDICRQSGTPEKEPFTYLMASIQALDGAEDEALELLETAIRLEPKNRIYAFHDPDFQALHSREEFSQLVQAS
ncbi:MAG: hypothetical protein AAF560_04195 [Acidobacteriota bacterium]